MTHEQIEALDKHARGAPEQPWVQAVVHALHTLLQLLLRHVLGMEDGVVPSETVAPGGEEPAFLAQLRIERRARVGCQNVEMRLVHFNMTDQLGGTVEAVQIIRVEAEDEEPRDENASRMKASYQGAIVLDAVVGDMGRLRD